MKGYHTKGVVQLCFSADGKTLFSVGVDYTVALYDTNTSSKSFGKLVSSGQTKGVCLHVAPAGKDGSDFVSVGEKHVNGWSTKKEFKAEKAKLGEHSNKTFLCSVRVGCFGGDGVAVGTNEGDLVILKQSSSVACTFAKIHDKAVNAIYCGDGDRLLTGGKDGRINLLIRAGDDFTKCASFCITSGDVVRSLSLSEDGRKLLVGTQSCQVFEYTASPSSDVVVKKETAAEKLKAVIPEVMSNASVVFRTLIVAHCAGELWGLAVHPLQMEFSTVGDDKVLRIWSLKDRKQRHALDLGASARCCAYSPDGNYIAVGFGCGNKKDKKDGMFRIYRNDPSGPPTLVNETKEAKQWISEIKFSPDGRTLAVGSHDNSVYLYGGELQEFKRKGKFSKHGAFISHFDFSSDSKVLASNCGAYEILFW